MSRGTNLSVETLYPKTNLRIEQEQFKAKINQKITTAKVEALLPSSYKKV